MCEIGNFENKISYDFQSQAFETQKCNDERETQRRINNTSVHHLRDKEKIYRSLLISHIECTLCIDAGIKGKYSNLWGDGQMLNYENVSTCRIRGIVCKHLKHGHKKGCKHYKKLYRRNVKIYNKHALKMIFSLYDLFIFPLQEGNKS